MGPIFCWRSVRHIGCHDGFLRKCQYSTARNDSIARKCHNNDASCVHVNSIFETPSLLLEYHTGPNAKNHETVYSRPMYFPYAMCPAWVSSMKWGASRRHFDASANNYQLLTLPAHITGHEDLRAVQDMADGHGWTKHVASLMPDLAWRVVCFTNAEFALYQGPLDLGDDDDDDSGDDVAGSDEDDDGDAWEYHHWGLLDEGPHPRHKALGNKDCLCMVRCLAWLDSPKKGLVSRTKHYFQQWWFSREGFQWGLSNLLAWRWRSCSPWKGCFLQASGYTPRKKMRSTTRWRSCYAGTSPRERPTLLGHSGHGLVC